MLDLLLIFASCALIAIALIAISNALMFPRLKPRTASGRERVAVLIPARNEADIIADTVRSLLRQDYPAFEVIVLDDHSSDGTAERAWAAGAEDARLRVLRGEPLPAGWLGKNWACHQLAAAATGFDLLLFTDADVSWSPGALHALVSEMERTRVDLLTIWPTQRTGTPGERLVVPLMALAVMGYLPAPLVNYSPWPIFAAANGQCLLFRRVAYDAIGGHAGVRARIVEDVALARRIKAGRLRLRMADGAGLIVCRMYHSWSAVRDGFAKNILAGHANSIAFLGLSTVFHWLLFIFPWLALFLTAPAWPSALIGLGIGVRALTAAASRQRVIDAILMPISVLLMTIIAAHSAWWRVRYGGPQWKGRTVHAT